MASEHPKVLISYSRDSPEHARRVLGLAERLRKDGVEGLDRPITQDPNEGWIRWMRQKVKQADKVLLAFTQESGAIRLSDRVGCRTPKGSLRPFSWRTKSPSSAQNSLHITLSGYC